MTADSSHKGASSARARAGRLAAIALAPLVVIGLLLLVSVLLGGGSDSGEADRYEEEAEQIAARLILTPQDPTLLLNLAGAHYHVAGQMVKEGSRQTSDEVLQQGRLASQAWSEYLAVASEPNTDAAKAMQSVLVAQAEAAPDEARYKEAMGEAAEAAEIVAEQAPSLDALMTVAYYRNFAFEWEAADRASKEALALAGKGPVAAEVRHALAEYRQLAREARRKAS